MSDTKIIALFLVIVSIAALWLDSQDKLVPVFTALTHSPPSAIGVGKFAVAFVLYLLAMSFLAPDTGMALTVLLVLGALLVNSQTAKANNTSSLLQELFSTQAA